MASRIDCVFIRKSSPGQDESGQIANVKTELTKLGIDVPSENWTVGTVKRRKVRSNEQFNRLLDLIENNRVRTVFIETQDRWGTADRHELFSLLAMLREHDTQLFDLRAGRDIAEKDLATEMMAFINSIKSEKELQDLSYRSLRSRINNFKERATWPNGTQPFGFGKQCCSVDGKLLWEWHPSTRTLGQTFAPNKAGELVPGPEGVKLPRKDRRDSSKLIPSRHTEHVKSVQRIFDLFTRGGLSRRQISARMNSEGRKFYDQPFTHSLIGMILTNPAYAGHIHFGKTRTAAYNSFDADGGMVEIKKANQPKKRPEKERLIALNAHEPLISETVWKLTQEKLKRESKRKSFPARNPEYYLKSIFVCGHCGKNMTGRTEINPKTKERSIVYFCSSYLVGRQSGIEQPCGAHRITHVSAEQLLRDRIKEMQLDFDWQVGKRTEEGVERQVISVMDRQEDAYLVAWDLAFEGTRAFGEYLDSSGVDRSKIVSFTNLARTFYSDFPAMAKARCKTRKLDWAEFKKAIEDAEAASIRHAVDIVTDAKAEHAKYTKMWVLAEDELTKETMHREKDRLLAVVRLWEPHTRSISDRLRQLREESRTLRAEFDKILSDWPKLKHAERAEALQRMFQTVTLFWDAKFHEGEKRPGRPRKTGRPGRYSYTLAKDRIQWEIEFPKAQAAV